MATGKAKGPWAEILPQMGPPVAGVFTQVGHELRSQLDAVRGRGRVICAKLLLSSRNMLVVKLHAVLLKTKSS